MMWRIAGLLACATVAVAVPAATVITNPVPAPIAPGMTVGLKLYAKSPYSFSLTDPFDGFLTRIQSLQGPKDGTGRNFVVDTRGTIGVVGAGGGTPSTWLDVRTVLPGFSSATNPGQTGLMGLAFHPNFNGDPAKPGYGVFYTIDTSAHSTTAPALAGIGPSIDHDNVVHQFTVADPGAATATIISQREIVRMAQPLSDHGAGTIAFNPTATPGSEDYGKLYIGLGDGGGEGDPYGNAQSQASPFGKILRIAPATGATGPAYTIPTDNPNLDKDGKPVAGQLPEIWMSGLRNPQSFGWDAKTGQMLIADIGQAQVEEVNIGVRGANYGWPSREGTFARTPNSADPNVYDGPANTSGYVDPVAQFDHEEVRSGGFGFAAISGAIAYRGTAIPELYGMVVLSELVSGRVFYYDPNAVAADGQAVLQELQFALGGIDTTLTALDGSPFYGGRVDLRMGQDAGGELYLLSKSYGDIYALTALTALPEPAGWATMIAGLGLVGAALRRRLPRGGRGLTPTA